MLVNLHIHDFYVALKSLPTAERYVLLKQPSSLTFIIVHIPSHFDRKVQAWIQALVVELLPVDCLEYQV